MKNIVIKADNISYIYRTDNEKTQGSPAVKNLNVQIEDGEFVAVIGRNGSGKSTFARLLNALIVPSDGVLYITNMRTDSEKDIMHIRQTVGMVFQNPENQFVAASVEEDVAFGPENLGVPPVEIVERVSEALKDVGMEEYREYAPHNLSGGQKQRVAIARALATEPKVLLCDEITSALDPNTTRSILELLQSINRKLGVTILMITHEMEVIEQICHRVAVINDGMVVEMGEVREVFVRPRSETARQLILPKGGEIRRMTGKKCLRIIFDGNSAFEPIISNMTLECRAVVNILYANTKSIEGKAYGEMLLQLPDDELSIKRILAYLDEKRIYYREEEINV